MDENQTQRSAETRNAYRTSARINLLEFINQAWPILEPAKGFVEGEHIEAIVAHLEAVTRGQIRNLIINIPPRHMKSLTVSVFWPVWEWIACPSRRWLFASYALSLAIRDSVRCRRLIESDWFQYHWGDRFRITSDQNTKQRFDNDQGGSRLAVSVGSAATGEGGDRVVVDDPHNVTYRESDAIRHAALDWWDQTMSTRLNDPKTGARVIVMQRLHEKDLTGHVLAQGSGYVHLYLPAEYESARSCSVRVSDNGRKFEWDDWRQKEGKLLWENRFSASEISDFKLRLGPSGYAGQFQQRPVPAGGARFLKEWFRYYDVRSLPIAECRLPNEKRNAAGANRQSEIGNRKSPRSETHYALVQTDGSHTLVPIDNCSRFAIMDPAGTEKDQNNRPCYTVIQVWDVTPAHDLLLVHQFRRQIQTPEVVEEGARIVRQLGCDFIGVEKAGLGLGVMQTLRTLGFTVRAISARGSKESRSEIAEIRMAAGMIYFPTDAPFVFDLEEELLHFPKGEYSDQVDALVHAAIYVQKRMGAPGTARIDAESDAASTPPGFADDDDEFR